MEHPTRGPSQEEGDDGDDIRMNAKLVPQQGKDETEEGRTEER